MASDVTWWRIVAAAYREPLARGRAGGTVFWPTLLMSVLMLAGFAALGAPSFDPMHSGFGTVLLGLLGILMVIALMGILTASSLYRWHRHIVLAVAFYGMLVFASLLSIYYRERVRGTLPAPVAQPAI
jgi:hypothetical protein